MSNPPNLESDQDQEPERKPRFDPESMFGGGAAEPTLFQTEDGPTSRAPGNLSKFYEDGAARAAANRAGTNHFRPNASVDLSNLLGKASSADAIRDTLTKLSGRVPTMSEINNARGFLDMTAYSEGTINGPDNGYGMIVRGTDGRHSFSDYSDHPNMLIHVKAGLDSTAAGRYQGLHRTFLEQQRKYGIPDYGHASQDAFGLSLGKDCGALNDIMAGNFETAIHKCHGIWASYPGANYPGQHMQAMDKLLEVADKSVAKYQAESATPVATNDLQGRIELKPWTAKRVANDPFAGATQQAAVDGPKPGVEGKANKEPNEVAEAGRQTAAAPAPTMLKNNFPTPSPFSNGVTPFT